MIIQGHFRHRAIEEIFSDTSTMTYWLAVEGALAQAQAKLGLIPKAAAKAITEATSTYSPDIGGLEAAMDISGVPIAALVKQLRTTVDAPHGDWVHYGATTQDIMDTAVVLQVKACVSIIENLLAELQKALAQLVERHRHTLMTARTRSQQALPTTFGLKAAQWLAPLIRHQERINAIKQRLLVVQLGGAAGTLAALGSEGLAVQEKLAEQLDLAQPMAVWHTQRDSLAEFCSWLSMVTGSLAKMGQDIVLLAQNEVAEVAESSDIGRGGSSTMPQKRNPIVSEALLTMHTVNVGHLSSIYGALAHEHERATGKWQVEWLALPPMLSLTAAALTKAKWLATHMEVHEDQMLSSVRQTNGLLLAEAASFLLGQAMPRSEAIAEVKSAVQHALNTKEHLIDVLAQRYENIDWSVIRDEKNYTGESDQLIDNILNAYHR